MAAPIAGGARYRFGPFELNLEGKELLEDRKRLHTPAQIILLLELLVTNADRVVTRQQVRQALWPADTYLDFEHSINTAIRRLRRLLRDSDAEPQYILTITGQGYRFIAPLEQVKPVPTASAAPPDARLLQIFGWPVVGIGLVFLWLLSGWTWWALHRGPRITGARALTTDGGLDLPARPASAGGLVYYLDREGGGWNLMRSDGRPADARAVTAPSPGVNTRLLDISAHDGAWLVGQFQQRGDEETLWRRTASGGSLTRLGKVRAYDAIWSPDGRAIFYGSRRGLWTAAADGSSPRLLALLPATPEWLAFSPDGTRLRFTSDDVARGVQAIWEWQPSTGTRLLSASKPRCCGGWSQDGNYYLYSEMSQGRWQIWAERVAGWPMLVWPWLPSHPRQLTFEPRSSLGAFMGFDREMVFYEREVQVDSVHYDAGTSRALVLLPGRSAIQLAYSHDGRHVAFRDTHDRSIWAADVGPAWRASHFRRISPAGMAASFPAWSPDGTRVAFEGQVGQFHRQAYTAPSTGGVAVPVLPGVGAELGMPQWSPDGSRLVVDTDSPDFDGIAIAAGGQLTPVPGSRPFAAAQWSPDGHWLAASSSDQHEIAVFSLANQRWRVLAHGGAFAIPQWSRNGWLYFQDLLAPGQPLFRQRPADAAPQRVADFVSLLASGVHRCGFAGFAPDGALLLELDRSTRNLYSAELKLP